MGEGGSVRRDGLGVQKQRKRKAGNIKRALLRIKWETSPKPDCRGHYTVHALMSLLVTVVFIAQQVERSL